MVRWIVLVEIVVILLMANLFVAKHLDKVCKKEEKVNTVETKQKVVKAGRVQTEVPMQESEETEASKKEKAMKEEAKKLGDSMDKKLRILVNKDHKVPDDYEVNLVTYKKTQKKVAEIISAPLKQMLKDGKKEGLSFQLCSAYRSNKAQQRLVDRDVRKYKRQGLSEKAALEKTYRSVQPAGYSEHVTGLAVDIVSSHNTSLDETQETTDEFQWLKAHCAEYGFILRYPDGKTDITGIIYEPWHFRYVGVEVEKFITENHLTYEEFYEMAW